MSTFFRRERAISVTWVITEIKLAIAKGYKILEVHEVYDYQVTQYNQETGEGGLFAEYINTFLKLKADASGILVGFEPRTMKVNK